ncbi:MAG: hypothetical protein VKO65_01065 [Cyanobacteriota bacterium]|nr:hypothetical protein [Cyanobacteriota bacterium]
MNRVFAQEPPIDVEVIEGAAAIGSAEPGPTSALDLEQQLPPMRVRQPSGGPLTMAAWIGVLGLVGCAVAGWGLWLKQGQVLQQERAMLLVERLRHLNPAPTSAAAQPAGQQAAGTGPELPPPPPDEPWMQQLEALPSGSGAAPQPLRVPVSGRLGGPAPQAARPGPNRAAVEEQAELPQLMGVIQSPGRRASAILQVQGNSISATVGEWIGSSGWRLRSAAGDTAILERGGEQREISIGNGF